MGKTMEKPWLTSGEVVRFTQDSEIWVQQLKQLM